MGQALGERVGQGALTGNGPPRTAETLVRWLVPPACREEVVGDLHERYTTRGQYVAEAICTIPFVVASRIRRTTDPQVLFLEAMALYLSFLVAAWKLDGTVFLAEQQGYARLAIAAAVAIVVLKLRDAYAAPGRRWPLKPIVDATFSFGMVCLCELALKAIDPGWAISQQTLIYGGASSIVLVATVRMLIPPNDTRPRGAT